VISESRRLYGLCTLAVVAVIVYGSLYPFLFSGGQHRFGPVRTLISTWGVFSGRADVLENILLYVPLGLSLFAFARGSNSRRILIGTMGGLFLSVAIEIAQYYDQKRDTSMSDVYANTAGALAGALAGWLIRRNPNGRLAAIRRQPFATFLTLCWLGYQLFPYVPTVSLAKYANSVRAMVAWGQMTPIDFFVVFAYWLVVAVLLEVIFRTGNNRLLLAVFAAMLLGKVIRADLPPSPADFASGAAAVGVWILVLSRLQPRKQIVAVLFLVAMVLLELIPAGRGSPVVNWIPLRLYLTEPIRIAMPSVFAKTFEYGALLWLPTASGLPIRVSAILASILVLTFGVVQTHFLRRSADITDLLLVLALAVVLVIQTQSSAQTPQPG
jgi:glycopeptide antibiotics resistance protein